MGDRITIHPYPSQEFVFDLHQVARVKEGRPSGEERITHLIRKLTTALIQEQRWGQAKGVARSIAASDLQASTLAKIGIELDEAQQREDAEHIWILAEKVAFSIPNNREKNELLTGLLQFFLESQRQKLALHLVHQSWLQTETRDDALTQFALVMYFAPLFHLKTITDLYDAFKWVEDFFQR